MRIAKNRHPLNRDTLVRLFRIYDGDPEEKYGQLFSSEDKCVFHGTYLSTVSYCSPMLYDLAQRRTVSGQAGSM